jgi:hypothetical protein
MEELEDTLSRNVLRMSRESDTAAYLWGRQKPTDTISDWRECIRWDWRIFKGWKERQTHPTSRKLSNRALTAQAASPIEDFLFKITGQRPVGGLVVFRSKLWWGLLLDENKRKRGRKYEGSESRYYWGRMIAAGWLDSTQAQPPGKKERCIACARGRASL